MRKNQKTAKKEVAAAIWGHSLHWFFLISTLFFRHREEDVLKKARFLVQQRGCK